MGIEQMEVESFSQRVPGAGDRATEFLQEVLERVQSEGVPVALQLVKKRKGRAILEAKNIRFGGFMNKSRPMRLEVYADPIGKNLNVGWELTVATATGFAANAGMTPVLEASRNRKDNSPDVRREVGALVSEFQEGVFLPVLSEFADSIGSAKNEAQGFFGT